MITLTNEQKFEAVKYRHNDQSKLLQVMTGVDLKIIISFMTLQLLLGSFLSQISLNQFGKIGLMFIDLSMSAICVNLLRNNYKRRIEVVGTIKNCNKFLRYSEPGFYIKKDALNAFTKFRPWFWLYIIAIGLSCVGIMVIMYSKEDNKCFKNNLNYKMEVGAEAEE